MENHKNVRQFMLTFLIHIVYKNTQVGFGYFLNELKFRIRLSFFQILSQNVNQ